MGLWIKTPDGTLEKAAGADGSYLPLTGGTLTGDLEIDGVIKVRKGGSAPDPSYSFGDGDGLGMYSHIANGWLRFAVGGVQRMQINSERVIVNNDLRVDSDLQVDGNSDLRINAPADFWINKSGTVFHEWGMSSGSQGGSATSITSNGYRNASGKWTSMAVNGITGAAEISLLPRGKFEVRVASNHPTGAESSPPVQFSVVDGLTRAYGDLRVDGHIVAMSAGTAAEPAIGFDGIDGMGIYTHKASNWLRFAVGGVQRMNIREDVIIMDGNLQVGGVIQLPIARDDSVVGAPNMYITSAGHVKHTTFQAAPKAFAIAEDIDTAEVLTRAETATMPVVDDDGVATTDAEVESLTVNEVVTALLAKVKQLSARIETLEK